MSVLYLVRHGETEWNRGGRIQGHTDIPLSDEGRWQATRLAERLAPVEFAAAFVSDLGRTRETAGLLLAGRTMTPVITAELRERAWGPLEGLTADERRQQFPQFAPAYPGAPTAAPPGAEGLAEMTVRAQRVRTLLEGAGDGNVLVVSHGGFLAVLISEFLGLPMDNRSRIQLNTSSLSLIEVLADRAIVFRLNDTCHLDGDDRP